MKNKQKQLNIKEKKQVNALKDLRSGDQTKLNKFLQKIMKVILKMSCLKLNDIQVKLLEIICFMNRASRYMIIEYLKQ